MARVSVTNGVVLEEWKRVQAASPKQKIDRSAFLRDVLPSVLDLIDGFTSHQAWRNLKAAALKKLDTLLADHKKSSSPKSKVKVDESQVRCMFSIFQC